MKIFWNPALILGLFVWIPAVTYSYSSQAPEDQDTSGDDESSGSDDDESSGSGMEIYVPIRFSDPVMTKEQTTKVPVTTASQSTLPTTTISSVDVVVIEKETTTVSLVDPETTTILIEKGFVPAVAEDYTTKAVDTEDNRPTVSVKVIDKKTTVPHMETVPVQTTTISSVDVVVIEKETTTVSLGDPETTTIFIEKGFVPAVAEDYTTKAVDTEDNRPTVSVKVIDKKTTVPHMETVPVQTTTISSVDVVVIEKETTTVSLGDPETTTIFIEKGFVPAVAEDYTTKAVVKEDNKPTVSVKVIDKKTTVPHMETVPVQTTKKAVVVTHPETTTMTTTAFMTTASRNDNPRFTDTVFTEKTESDFDFEDIIPRKIVPVNAPGEIGASSGNDSFLERKEVLACVIAGGVVGLIFSVMLVSLMVYRMKKKDEGSYALQDMPQPYVYQKAPKQEEFFA
nr:syndecan-3-like [Misgurnus anguillicaudatus]